MVEPLKKALPSARLLYYDNPAVAANRINHRQLLPEDDPADNMFVPPHERNELSAMKWWAKMHRREEIERKVDMAVLD